MNEPRLDREETCLPSCLLCSLLNECLKQVKDSDTVSTSCIFLHLEKILYYCLFLIFPRFLKLKIANSFKRLMQSENSLHRHISPSTNFTYRTHAIITCGLYTFYPLFEVHLCTVTFGLMYG